MKKPFFSPRALTPAWNRNFGMKSKCRFRVAYLQSIVISKVSEAEREGGGSRITIEPLNVPPVYTRGSGEIISCSSARLINHT